uniref:Uncharacterized protein n=1 Tax=Anguilla anguilla TaxID=7936 RepID=A0A0E9X1E7_ANGAN
MPKSANVVGNIVAVSRGSRDGDGLGCFRIAPGELRFICDISSKAIRRLTKIAGRNLLLSKPQVRRDWLPSHSRQTNHAALTSHHTKVG